MRVALATQDMKTVNAHFASARNLAIYEVGEDDHTLLEAVQFSAVSAEDGQHADIDDDRIGPKVAACEGCALLFVKAIGGPAAAKVVNAKVHPIKLKEDESIESVIGRVQTMMKGNPPPWLRKIIMAEKGITPDFEDEEEDA